MNRTKILVILLILSIIITFVYFLTESSRSKKPTEIIKNANTLEIPQQMVTDGAPPVTDEVESYP